MSDSEDCGHFPIDLTCGVCQQMEERKAGGDTGGGAEKKQRKCGLCHEPGHTRLKCPMKSNWGSEDTGWS